MPAGGNGTATLDLKADVEDSLQVFGTSLSNQLQDEVFIYDFKHLSGDTVLDTLGLKTQIFNQVLVRFMVFGPKKSGDRSLKGFYQWDPSITVSQ